MPWLIPIVAAGASIAGGAITNAAAQGDLEKGQPTMLDQQDVINPTQIGQAAGAGQNAINQQQQFLNALQGQGGIQNQADVYAQQQALAGQLGQMAQGAGPNPALAQLAQTTGQNIAGQAALMAGQRGAGANAGLLARQAAQQGAGIQQGAVGQAATMRAQQQLAAIDALQRQQGMLGGLATQQVGQQAGAIQGLGSLGAQQQNIALQQQQMRQQQQMEANRIKAGLAQSAAEGTRKTGAGILGGVGGALTQLGGMMAQGGTVQKGGPNSFVGRHLMASGGKVPVMVSPGEIYLTPKQADKVVKGQMNPLDGQRIPGKAKVAGDSLKNDTVPRIFESGGVVIKRTKAKDPKEAAKFVAAVKKSPKRK